MPTTREELDQVARAGCQECVHVGAEPHIVYLHGRCHPGGAIEASYREGSGVVRIGCKECGKVIAQIAVESVQAEIAADKLSDVWLALNEYARGTGRFNREDAASLLRSQSCPGWRE